MSPAILNLLAPPAAVKSAAPDAGVSAADTATGADAFAALLAGKIESHATLKAAPGATPAADSTSAALQAQIAKMFQAGASKSQVIAALADKLAASVAHALGVTTSDARAQLTAAFAAALAPPGDPGGAQLVDPGGAQLSIADQAKMLAQRFLQLQDIATNVVNGTHGQHDRIAGSFLDAIAAKEIPAPTAPTKPTEKTRKAAAASDSASAQVALPSAPPPSVASAPVTERIIPLTIETPRPTGPVPSAPIGGPAATAASSAPPLQATAAAGAIVQGLQAAAQTTSTVAAADASGDGRKVALGSRVAVSANGDTALGRVLTRAAIAADNRTSVGLTQLVGAAAADEASPAALANEALAPASNEDAMAPAPPSSAAVTQFVKSFAAAVAGDTTSGAPHAEAQPAAMPLGLATHQTPLDVHVPFVPGVAPFTIERTAPTAPAEAAVRPPPVDQSAIVDQVLRGAFMRNTGASSEMRLSLVPETLGDVSVKLVVTAGNVSAHVVAQTPEVRDALVAAQPQLSKSLAESGLKLQSFTVDLSGGGMGGQAQQQGDASQNSNRWRRASALSGDDDSDDASLDAIPSFGPPLLTSMRTRDFNYLA